LNVLSKSLLPFRLNILALAVIACNTASTVSLPALRVRNFAFRLLGRSCDQTRCTLNGEWCGWLAGNECNGKTSLYA
jgi:hypothetical protein